MRGSIWLTFIFIVLTHLSTAQEIDVRGGFLEDSLGIGEEIHYWITASYPQDLEIVFPDSNFNFSPFEYVAKYYKPSDVIGNIINDTTVYTLQSFEIDPVQYLLIPAYVIKSKDSLIINTPLDSIYFKALVAVASDTTKMKQNIDYQKVFRAFNYPLMWIILGVFSLIAIGIFLIYGKKIRNAITIRRLKRDYGKFSEKITVYIRSLKIESSSKIAEEAITFWKVYLEKLEKIPFSKLTTKEILMYEYTAELKDSLNAIDRCVYGKIDLQEIYKSFQSLEDFTQDRYNKKIDSLRHGNT